MTSRRAGIVTGLQLEARIARGNLPEARVVCRGMGPKRAREAAERLVREGVSGLISFGLAGGLTAEARPGLILLPARIRTPEGGEIATDMLWRERLLGLLREKMEVSDAPLAAVRRPLPLYPDKAAMWARTQCVAADMESAAVAAAARRNGLPFIALRAVADPLEFSLPPVALAAMGADGRLKPFRLALLLWRNPAQIGPLRELAGHSGAAKAALRRAALTAGAALLSAGRGPIQSPSRASSKN